MLRHLFRLSIKIIRALKRHKPGYVFTFECGVASFIVAALQRVGFMTSMKHIILQFIMREKEPTLRSKLKYLFMRLILSSIDTAVCSSMTEVVYYPEVFRWNTDKTIFVHCYFDPKYLNITHDRGGDFILTAGRTFRDYDTFFKAVNDIGNEVVVVASPWNINNINIPKNVSIKYDIPLGELTELMRKSTVVVVPLEDRKISTGQSIFLQAMAMGKAVVVTKTAGTVDYINHLENGLLVPPGDNQQMCEAIKFLLENEKERINIGKNAHKWVIKYCLPHHYFGKVRQIVLEEGLRKQETS